MAFLAISSLFPSLHSVLVSFSGGRIFFLLCVQVLGLQFPKGFSRLHFVCAFFFSFSKVSARFLQRGSSTFLSVRFQLASFQQGFVCVCVCVCVCVFWFCDICGDFLGQHFQLISFEQGSFLLCGFAISVELLGACISGLFPSASSPTRFSVIEVQLRLLCSLVEGSRLLMCSYLRVPNGSGMWGEWESDSI
jgi:hypothetical protein